MLLYSGENLLKETLSIGKVKNKTCIKTAMMDSKWCLTGSVYLSLVEENF